MEHSHVRKAHFPLKMISFVTPAQSEIINEARSEFVASNVLNGEQAKEFYDSIVSSPSTSTTPLRKKKSVIHNRKERTSLQTLGQSNFKSNAIFHHAQDGNLKEIQDCIFHGCSVNQLDMYGWTPLMCAACEGHYDIVEYLLKNGANLNIKNSEGLTALNIAEKKNNLPIVKLLQIGFVEEKEKAQIAETEENEKYCNNCKIFYKESTILHNRSIAHLFSCKKTNLSTFYYIPESNKGFQMMLRSGWDKNKGLGSNADGRKFPIKTVLKEDRSCIGRKKVVHKITHFGPHDNSSVDRHGVQIIRKVRERTLKKWQREKFDKKERQKEINFRRQFHSL